MEIYTTSFTYPRRLRHAHSPTSSLDFPPRSNELRRASSYSAIQQSNGLDPHGGASPSDYEALQKLGMMAMSLHGIHISFTPADQGRAWSFQVSGAYPQVMSARGMLLKGCPVQVCSFVAASMSSLLTEWCLPQPESVLHQGRAV